VADRPGGSGGGPTVIFLHIGKTAGWTLRQVLYRNVRPELVMRVRPPPDRPRGFLNEEPLRAFASLPEGERARPRLLVSHMIFGIHESVPRPSTYITLLRDPVARTISQYAHVLRTTHHRLHRAAVSGELTLERYVCGGEALEVDNGQARALAGDASTPFGQCSEELLEAALGNLAGHVSVAGLTERFDETLVMLGAEFGWRNLYYVRTNTAPAGQRLSVSDADRRMIEERNRLDCELYRVVSDRFQARIDDEPGFGRRLELHRRGNAIYRPWGQLAYRLRRTAVRATRSRPSAV
jgi:Galactose-3-O-sulfotransferase